MTEVSDIPIGKLELDQVFHIGFPPADEAARCFLTEPSSDPAAPLKRAQAFLIALFLITADVLRGVGAHMVPEVLDKLETDALKFRSLMTKGQSFIETNVFRRNFFQRVVVQAKEVCNFNSESLYQFNNLILLFPAHGHEYYGDNTGERHF